MKLVKLTDDHYVIVDDSEIKEEEWFYNPRHNKIGINYNPDGCKKITHSTQPLDIKITDEGVHLPDWSKVKALSPRVVKELIGNSEQNNWDVYFDKNNKLNLK